MRKWEGIGEVGKRFASNAHTMVATEPCEAKTANAMAGSTQDILAASTKDILDMLAAGVDRLSSVESAPRDMVGKRSTPNPCDANEAGFTILYHPTRCRTTPSLAGELERLMHCCASHPGLLVSVHKRYRVEYWHGKAQ